MTQDDIFRDVCLVIDQVLQLNGRGREFTADTPLLGAVPEFDSMAVVSVLTTLEEHFGIAIDDDEVDAEVFETVGSLAHFVGQKAGTVS